MAVGIQTGGLVDRERLRLAVQLLREAGPSGLTKHQLARKLGSVSLRTVDRAIQLLEEQGAKVERIRSGRPSVIHFQMKKGPSWDESISTDARLALRLAALMLAQGGAQLWQEKIDAIERLASERMSSRDRRVFHHLQSAVRVQGGVEDPVESPDVLEPILKALETGKSLWVEYRSAASAKPKVHEVIPAALTHDLYSGGAFLLAWEPGKRKALNLRLSRILQAKPQKAAVMPDPEAIERAAHYQIGGWLSTDEPFEVQVRIEGANWVQSMKEAPPALPDFDFKPAKDGKSAIATFKANHPSGPGRWILQFGEAAEVIAPEWLRTEIAVRLKKALEKY
ncbi:helix-turn-helix transcriptional regulator [Holophaga foetida]|uniref:helix-turn-helix transcriptional regulator n=1 Tax=Holophaga foetida TaxID=35839 RepID=UPI0002474D1B|nr:transcriptional regulator [Holophaga foetida]